MYSIIVLIIFASYKNLSTQPHSRLHQYLDSQIFFFFKLIFNVPLSLKLFFQMRVGRPLQNIHRSTSGIGISKSISTFGSSISIHAASICFIVLPAQCCQVPSRQGLDKHEFTGDCADYWQRYQHVKQKISYDIGCKCHMEY